MDSVIEWKNRIWTTSVQSTQIISMRSRDYNKNAQPWSRRSCQLCFGCTNRCTITSHLINFLVHLQIQSRTSYSEAAIYSISLVTNQQNLQSVHNYLSRMNTFKTETNLGLGVFLFERNLNEIVSVCFIFSPTLWHIYSISHFNATICSLIA